MGQRSLDNQRRLPHHQTFSGQVKEQEEQGKMTAKQNKKAIKYIAYNPVTRKYEEVHTESEVLGNNVIALFWSGSLNKWVTIPQ